LYPGEHKTLFVRYRIPPQNQDAQTALVNVYLRDSNIFEQLVVLTDPTADSALQMLRYSGAALKFADTVKKIGGHYHNGAGDPARLAEVLELSRETTRTLQTVKGSLQNENAFVPELTVLAKYTEILSAGLSGSPRELRIPLRTAAPAEERRPVTDGPRSRMSGDRAEGSFSRMTR
jgi:Ca-activated chloride channel family protein